MQEAEHDLYDTLAGTDAAYWLGFFRKEANGPWHTGKGETIENYGVYGDLELPWSAKYKNAADVLVIPEKSNLAFAKNGQWFPTDEEDDTKALAICTYVCRHHRKFP